MPANGPTIKDALKLRQALEAKKPAYGFWFT